jgi:hypothetical protein
MPTYRERFHAKAEAGRAKAEAGRAEGARLMGLSPGDLAAELMAAFGPDGLRRGQRVDEGNLIVWLFREYPRTRIASS